MRIGVLVREGCLGSATAAIIDILRAAQLLSPAIDPAIPALDLQLLGRKRQLRTSDAMSIATTGQIRDAGDCDVVVVPATAAFSDSDITAALAAPCGKDTITALTAVDLDRTRVAAACTGVFPLAEAGLLDGRTATTSWFLSAEFRRRYPSVHLDLDSMVVTDGPLLTAGAAFAHIDLALTIVRTMSADVAAQIARTLVIDERPSQSSYIAYDQINHQDDLVLQFERYVRANLDQQLDIAATARSLGTSRRTLERRTNAALGASPLNIVQRLRLERANHLKRTTNLSTQTIAQQVGYANAETLRALQRRLTT